jgi:hypothetical protein
VKFRLALLTIVVLIENLIFRHEAHAGAMLPNLAGLALDHELSSIRIVFYRLRS